MGRNYMPLKVGMVQKARATTCPETDMLIDVQSVLSLDVGKNRVWVCCFFAIIPLAVHLVHRLHMSSVDMIVHGGPVTEPFQAITAPMAVHH